MFRKVLIANRGVIACRIIRTLRAMGVDSVAVYSEADRASLHVEQADEALCIGPAPAAQSYLSIPAILDAAKRSGAQAIHPGYGFLSENAAFAEAVEAAGLTFIGPAPRHLHAFGLKHTSREIASENCLPLLPGTGVLADSTEALLAAARIGYPVMLKSSAGGGGIGMRLCCDRQELQDGFESVSRLGRANFGDASVFLEKAVLRARHIEVQIFGDGQGGVLGLGERDCSVQRRNQKVIEETPAPGLADRVRLKLFEAATRLGQAVLYRSAGTVEFIYDDSSHEFYFLEVNTRLQVEHGITEEVRGIDLVEWMVRLAAGDLPPLDQLNPGTEGAAIQVRIYAEDPARNFQPSAGRLSEVHWPSRVRVETAFDSGAEVTPFYDPLLAKIIAHGKNRDQALASLRAALAETRIHGIETNLRYLRQVVADDAFTSGGVTTALLRDFPYARDAIEVIEPGTQTTIQDYPGRTGYWHVGVPPSGPMDSLALRLANRLVGNPEGAACLEIAVTGPTLRFTRPSIIAITGADYSARLNGAPVPLWQSIHVPANSVIEFSSASGPGARAYLAIAGSFDLPEYLGSRSTFILGQFGGHGGRVLQAGDVLDQGTSPATEPRQLPDALIPNYSDQCEIGVLYGPHGAPDFFTAEDIEMFFATGWKVHHNSDRTGVRLLGPKPAWARRDGGEAGLHPSNIHDNAYAIGTVDFTGDMPVILGPDGPSLGGFVCPATVIQAELWKLGQLRPGDSVRFVPVSQQQAEQLERDLDTAISTLTGPLPSLPSPNRSDPIILRDNISYEPPRAPSVRAGIQSVGAGIQYVYRADGDKCLLVEYGPNILDLDLRFRVHGLEAELRALNLPAIIDITPGVRSLHIHYDSRVLRREALLDSLDACESRIGKLDDICVPSRTVYLPLSWDDLATQFAIRKYMQSVRPDAPWCPSNIEFIRRINGLASIDDVYRTVFDARYLVLGLGDVYLGAPVATPLDPRHRLVTTKYNPARTWTPENAVGIGGAYLCVYGMEGPGGYQFVGRTVQMWNRWRTTAEFEAGKPWLLRCFDQIRFYPVDAGELLEIRERFPRGGYPLRIEPAEFRLRDYHSFLDSIRGEAAAFKRHQQAAFEEERERWAAAGKAEFLAPEGSVPVASRDPDVPEGCQPVRSPMTASVWNIAVERGQRVEAGQKLLVLEAMKMEILVASPAAGVVESLNCSPGALVSAGQHLVTLRPEVPR